jgi:quinol monooxygenase YgiN
VEKMPYMLITHKVEDYAKWKSVFDDVAPMRREAGEKSARLYRDDTDPQVVTAIFEWDTLEHAHEYAGSARLKTAMKNAGVVSQPEITFLNAA